MPIAIRNAGPGDLDTIRLLFREYAQTPGVGVCMAGFEQEIADLPARYEILLLGEDESGAVGTGALRRLAPGTGELKRLYVRPRARGTGAGRLLTRALIEAARGRRWERLRLDTLPSMQAAQALYESEGFRRIERYYEGAPAGALFYELAL
jgi:ribosomal protein S18 acetylase RimI-like enzyme